MATNINSNNVQDASRTVTTLPIEFETNWQNEYNKFRIDTASHSLNISESCDTMELSLNMIFI